MEILKHPDYLEHFKKSKYQARVPLSKEQMRGLTPYQIYMREKVETVPPRSPVEEWMMKELGYIARCGYVLKNSPSGSALLLVSEKMADKATCDRVLTVCRAYFHQHPPVDPFEIAEAYMDALGNTGAIAWGMEENQREKLEKMPVPEQVM